MLLLLFHSILPVCVCRFHCCCSCHVRYTTQIANCSQLRMSTWWKFKQTRVNGGSNNDLLKVASSECQSDGNSHKCRSSRVVAQRWLREGPHAALRLRRDWLPAGALQRGLVDDAEVRHSGARYHRLRAVVRAVRLLGKLCNCHLTPRHTFPVTDRTDDGVPTDQL